MGSISFILIMAQGFSQKNGRFFRKKRVRANISGSDERPRISVFRSLRSISAQVIDDALGKTLVSADLRELPKTKLKNTVEGAREVGKFLAKKCLAAGVKSVVFDRNGYQYHGRVKAVAEGAREGGLLL